MAKYPSHFFNLHYSPGGVVLSSISQDCKSLWMCPWHLAIEWQNVVLNPHYKVLKCVYRSLPPWLIKTTSRLWKDDYWKYDGLTHQGLVLQKRKIHFTVGTCTDFSLMLIKGCWTRCFLLRFKNWFAILLLRSNPIYMMLKKWKLTAF